MITRRKTVKPDKRPIVNTQQQHGGGYKPAKVIDDWTRSGDATARPEFDHGLQRKPKKSRSKWY
jgi:hypothetical protein